MTGAAYPSLLYMNPIEEIFEGPVRNQYGRTLPEE